MLDGNAIRDQILRLLNVRKKLEAGDYLTSREEDDVSVILGVPKFKDGREMKTKIDDLFSWLNSELKRK